MRMMKIAAAAVVAVLIAQWALRETPEGSSPAQADAPLLAPVLAPPAGVAADREAARDPVAEAFERRSRNLLITVEGRVDRILSDDHEGSRHQRFILRTFSEHTVLVAHNIDLAPRLEGLKQGERLVLHGEYEWNPQGGVIHWTHHDPDGTHPAGYIERNGRRYQ
jgi:Protein of unknown function (DUF3465)